jgi:cholesterol oxidase
MSSPPHFDAVVVGSGFGGSTVTQRLAEQGLSVCLLERGKPYPPGSFPRSPQGVSRNFWDPSEGLYGMFNVWSFRHIEGLVSSGLGGGSLIYANVLLRMDEAWFGGTGLGDGRPWPLAYRDLEPHYDRVEARMRPQRFPLEHADYAATAKTLAFKAAAEARGLDWDLLPLAVLFGNEGEPPSQGKLLREPLRNLHDRDRLSCVLCGECDVGCNYGAKNTLDYTHLTAAQHDGAAILTLAEVKRFAPRESGGYTIEYVQHEPDRPSKDDGRELAPRRTLTADRLVLSAGTFGSPFLLLKNRAALPALSPRLGTAFCGNGDLLGFFLRARGRDKAPRTLDAGRGPVITSRVRGGDALDGGGAADGDRGFYIEDAGHPEFVNWLVEATQAVGLVRRGLRFARRRLVQRLMGEPRSDISGEIRGLLGDCAVSSSSMAVLGMGRDVPDGTMRLSGKGYLDVDWKLDASGAYFRRLAGTMKALAGALGADFQVNPSWFARRVVTVHPLGGCPMGTSAADGVVDTFGEVFGHPGLYVADGSVMPGPVGANPSLTIAAVADRTADRILAQSGR